MLELPDINALNNDELKEFCREVMAENVRLKFILEEINNRLNPLRLSCGCNQPNCPYDQP